MNGGSARFQTRHGAWRQSIEKQVRQMSQKARERTASLLFIGPAVVLFATIVLIPLFQGIFFSFTDWNGLGYTTWLGLDNYAAAVGDPQFLGAFWLTIRFAAVAIITINATGLGLALLVTSGMKISSLLRGVFYVPNLIGGLVLGFVWNFIFTQTFPAIGQALGIPGMDSWLTNFQTGFWGLIILTTWQMSGYMMVIYIAALQAIPKDLVEAAGLDGARGIHIFRHITLPMIAPAFTVSLFLTLLNTFKLYDQNLALTGGGPGTMTQLVAMHIYNTAYKYEQMSIGQAKSILFLIAVVIITLTQVTLTKKREIQL